MRTFLLVQQFAAREIGERIARARRERGLTQEQLAEMCAFSTRSLQDYELGVTIPYKHLNDLSAILGRRTDWFLHGDDIPESELEQCLERIEARLDAICAAVERIERAAG